MASCALLLLVVLIDGCSPESSAPQEDARRHLLPEERTVALARENGCAVLSAELRKSVGTNPVYSIDVQRVLNANKRVTAICYLTDLVQRDEHAQAIFQIDDLELGAWSGTCVARLECSTNFVATLASEEILSEWGVAFEVTSNRHGLHFSKGATEDDSAEAWSVLTVEGKLLGLQKGP
jgi:hypothetical protein